MKHYWEIPGPRKSPREHCVALLKQETRVKIVVTYREIIDKGCWDEFCEEHGLNPWFINEGLGSSDEEVSLTPEEAKKYGLLTEHRGR